ncbi:hypothetical protein PsorP6_019404 [Peronosclerospora sorghi]|nr:hypothetical protein PsorP6_019361 [Peronosclerospora sorghi]KAI9895576.1 hypothetical protein PsorP6_019404 [Peronosclerospora sorghi]
MAKTFEMEMDTVFRALHFLEQYLSVHSVDRVSLQLLGMFCMWTASKMYEREPILLEEMALMCELKFSRVQMVDVEVDLTNKEVATIAKADEKLEDKCTSNEDEKGRGTNRCSGRKWKYVPGGVGQHIVDKKDV